MTKELFREEARLRYQAEPWQPPLLSKAPSGLVMGLLAVLAAGTLLAFATTFRFAQKEQVRGYLTPASGWSRVSSRDFAFVEQLLVGAGDIVRAGDVLLELSSGQGLDRAETVSRRLLAEIRARKSRLEDRTRLIDSQYDLDRALHVQERGANERELARLEQELSFHRSHLETARKRLEKNRWLNVSGLLSDENIMTLQDEVASHSLGVSGKEREAERLRSILNTSDMRLRKLSVDAQREQAIIAGQIHALAMEESRIRVQGAARVLAPRDGVVASIRVRAGDQLQPGDVLLDIVPETRSLQARLFARSSAMGYVKPGQQVKVDLDAFSYRRYGAQTGKVRAIFETTLKIGELDMAPSLGISPGEPVFQISVDFPEGFQLAPEQQNNLRPGMTLTADLVIDRRTLLDWILEPLGGAVRRL